MGFLSDIIGLLTGSDSSSKEKNGTTSKFSQASSFRSYESGTYHPKRTITHIQLDKEYACTVTEIYDKSVVVSLDRYTGVTGTIGIGEMSYAYVQKPSYMFKVGQKIKAKAIDQNGYNGKVKLSFKATQRKETYRKGDIIEVCLVEKNGNDGLVAITTDGNLMLCYVPAWEISWTNDVNLKGQKNFQVKITQIESNAKSFNMVCSIKQTKDNPWKKAAYEAGMTISVCITEYSDNELKIITADEFCLPGFVPKKEFTWLKREDEIVKEDLQKIGGKISVKIKKFDPQVKRLCCSIRDLQPNPWLDVHVGDIVKGAVLAVENTEGFKVCLKNGIVCNCNDKKQLSRGKKHDFLVLDVNPRLQTAIVSNQYLQREEEYANFVLGYFNQRSVKLSPVQWKEEHNIYVLFPQNILYKGEAVSFIFAKTYIDWLNYEHPAKFNVIGRVSLSNDTIVDYIAVDLYELGIQIESVDSLKLNKAYKAHLVKKTENFLFLGAAGSIGYVEKLNGSSDFVVKDEPRKVIFVGGDNHPLRLAKFNFCESVSEEEETSLNDFLTEDELIVIEEQDKTLVELAIKESANFTRENCHVINEEIYVVFDDSQKNQMNHFFEEVGNDFSSKDFWVSMKVTDRSYQSVAIFDSEDSILLCTISDKVFHVDKIFCSKNNSDAQTVLNSFSRRINLLLPGGKLHICNRYNTGNVDFERMHNCLLRQFTIVTKILPQLSSKARNRKEIIGNEYLTMSNFLQFQRKREQERLKDVELSVPAETASIGTYEGKPCLILRNIDCSNFFEDNEDTQTVKVNPSGVDKEYRGVLVRKDNDSCCVYFKYEADQVAFAKAGFVLIPEPNVYHLKIQEKSIDNFVYKKSLLDSLDKGKLCPPVEDSGVVFFDSKFDHVEKGNNQPMAIRKAVGNNDIFLIQGPPGTGKTSVIVEIIRQLVKKGERVLVCCQAHSAVKNIYDRLKSADKSLNVGFLDDDQTMQSMSYEDHVKFLKRNILMLGQVQKGEEMEVAEQSFQDYPSYLVDFYQKQHGLLGEFVKNNKNCASDLMEIVDDFLKEINGQDEKGHFYTASHVHSLQVVMGTCIGIGTDSSIKKSGVQFDTLIVDEAGKANMSETNVPMSIARKYILVGDHNQLPPYMDIQEVRDFMASEETKGETDESRVKKVLSTSLFEDFLNDPSFPEESKVLLNYQYRMNPTIGSLISRLFYEEQLNNGVGTDSQVVNMDNFPDAITFYDTGKTKNRREYDPYEKSSGKGNIFNPCEIQLICDKIVPELETMLIGEENLSVGIVTPYSEQVRRLKTALHGTSFEKCVYTIDNIQGQEYDIVVLSFVRAFPSSNGSVGFLDDLRRLNVALSRAKKKLIMIGNADTLCRPEVHKSNGLNIGRKKPEEIFSIITRENVRHAEFNNIDKLKKFGIQPGHVFKDCAITCKVGKQKQARYTFKANILDKDGNVVDTLSFAFSAKHCGEKMLKDGDHFDFIYKAENSSESDRPLFEMMPRAVNAIVLDDGKQGRLKLSDNSVVNVVFDNQNYILRELRLGNIKGLVLPYLLRGHEATLDNEELCKRVNSISYSRKDKYEVRVVRVNSKGVYVWCDSLVVLGFIVKQCNSPSMKIDDKMICTIYKVNNECVIFNYLKRTK